jgi:hypothetical protein
VEGLLPCVRPGADESAVAAGVVGVGSGVEVGTVAGEVGGATGPDVAGIGPDGATGELLTASATGGVDPAPVWLLG